MNLMETTDTKQFIKYALKLLGVRDHFSSEIISKLKVKKANAAQVEEVLEYLNKFKYLDDIKTLRKFALEVASAGRGVNYFKKKLYDKGALEFFSRDVFPIETEISAARVFIKKLKTPDGDEILKKLLSRGFSNEAVFLILKELKKGEVLENRSDF
jgi:SOS response regulatory protein OraA/RecX